MNCFHAVLPRSPSALLLGPDEIDSIDHATLGRGDGGESLLPKSCADDLFPIGASEQDTVAASFAREVPLVPDLRCITDFVHASRIEPLPRPSLGAGNQGLKAPLSLHLKRLDIELLRPIIIGGGR